MESIILSKVCRRLLDKILIKIKGKLKLSIIGKLLEKLSKIELGLEFQGKCVIIESEDEEIQLPPDEYKRVMQVLETWLKSNSSLKRQKYLWKGIQSTEDSAYMYTFKKSHNIKGFIIIDKEVIS